MIACTPASAQRRQKATPGSGVTSFQPFTAKAIAHVHANGNFGAVFLRHAGGKIKILYGNGAQDAAPHAEGKILFNAGFVTDAATDLDKQPALLSNGGNGGHVGGGVIPWRRPSPPHAGTWPRRQ